MSRKLRHTRERCVRVKSIGRFSSYYCNNRRCLVQYKSLGFSERIDWNMFRLKPWQYREENLTVQRLVKKNKYKTTKTTQEKNTHNNFQLRGTQEIEGGEFWIPYLKDPTLYRTTKINLLLLHPTTPNLLLTSSFTTTTNIESVKTESVFQLRIPT